MTSEPAMDLDPLLRKFQKELSAGTVSLVLLSVLDQAREPMYGYQIAKRLEQGGEGILSGKQSALYPVLRNLDAAGLLASDVEPSVAGPPRRYYRITPLGREVLQAWTATWRSTRRFVDHVLEGNTP
jgi:PadR family transcriptional regulator PadR